MNMQPRSVVDKPYKLYFASAFGAFCLGFGDLLNNGHSATVLKINEIMKQLLQFDMGAGGLLALIVLAILGVCVCWVQQPKTRLDAFARGFSVFAVLAVATPFEAPNEFIGASTTTAAISSFPDVQADDHFPLRMRGGEQHEHGNVEIIFKPNKANARISNAWVALRNYKTKKLIMVTTTKTHNEKLKLSRLPLGKYLMEIEIPNFRHLQIEISIKPGIQRYELSLESSTIPSAVQRLASPKKYKLKSLR